MSQPAREFIVKIIELSLWGSDLIIGHLLLFMLTPPILVPYFDRFHATILCRCFILLRLRNNVVISLVTTIQANSRTVVFFEAKTAAPMDCWYCSGLLLALIDCR